MKINKKERFMYVDNSTVGTEIMTEQPIILDMMHCNYWIEKDWKYCPGCGKKVIPL